MSVQLNVVSTPAAVAANFRRAVLAEIDQRISVGPQTPGGGNP
jgi:hypothetical protein